MYVEVVPSEIPGAAVIPESARRAAGHIRLSDRVTQLVLALDAPEFEGSGYWQLEPLDDRAVRATLYGSPSDILRMDTRVLGIDLARLDAVTLASTPGVQPDPLLIDRWLHRNLLQLDDLMLERVRPPDIKRKDAPGLQACWDVWTDGRLRHWQHPGLSQAERRRVFYRVFADRGLLLPRHWGVFHELWEGQLAGHDGLVDAIHRLPAA